MATRKRRTPEPGIPREWLTDAQGAQFLNVGTTRYHELEKLPDFPEPAWFGPRGKRRHIDALRKWAQSRRRGITVPAADEEVSA